MRGTYSEPREKMRKLYYSKKKKKTKETKKTKEKGGSKKENRPFSRSIQRPYPAFKTTSSSAPLSPLSEELGKIEVLKNKDRVGGVSSRNAQELIAGKKKKFQ